MTGYSAHEVAAAIGQHEPTDQQARVIEADLAPTLVVAGAGSGKTQTMSLRIVWLVANGLVAPEQVLGLTFTRKAAAELAERVRRQLAAWRGRQGHGAEALAVGPTVATYNSYAASVVADHALRVGHDPGARVLTEATRWRLTAQVVHDFGFDEPPGRKEASVTTAVLKLADQLADHLLAPDEAKAALESLAADLEGTGAGGTGRKPPAAYRDAAASVRERAQLMDVVAAYRRRKAELGLMDYADQVALAGELAAVGAVGAGERSRFSAVILDEYQDTSVVQLAFLQQLFGGGHPVMAVGDPHQSIYGWRGASAGGLEQFVTDFPGAHREPAPVLSLSVAWRNDLAVLDVANVVAEPLRAASSIDVSRLAPRPGAGHGVVDARYLPTVQDEAAAVAEYLDEHWSAARGERTTAAVLCRRRAQFVEITQALRDRGLPFEVVGLGGLLDTPEVVDVVSALQAAHDPSRGDALMRLLTSARMRLGVADIAHLGAWGAYLARRDAERPPEAEVELEGDEVDDRSIVEAIEQLPPPGWRDRWERTLTPVARERMVGLARVVASLRSLTYLPVADLVVSAERLLGLDIELAARGGPQARVHLDRLVAVAEEFQGSLDGSAATLGAFLEWLADAAAFESGLEPGTVDVEADRIQVLTVHQAKGLEWDVVVVPGLREGAFPSSRSPNGWLTSVEALPYPLRGDYTDGRLPRLCVADAADTEALKSALAEFKAAHAAHQLAEDRRVAYVAVTRARRRLLLTGAWWDSQQVPRGPSVLMTQLVDAGAVAVDAEATRPAEGETNPVTAQVVSGQWPGDPLADGGGARREAVEAAARRVTEARDAVEADAPGAGSSGAGWAGESDRIARLLLAEESARRSEGPVEVVLPVAASPTALTSLRHDRQRYLENLRRPVPSRPSLAALRGTLFHHWVEQHYRTSSLVDIDALPSAEWHGQGEGEGAGGPDEASEAFRAAFLASPWADRIPVALEQDLVLGVGPLVLRARPDAVFAEPGGGFVVVDWKTGRQPSDPDVLRERELQLALYRLAWAEYAGVGQDEVAAAFFFAATGQTLYSQVRVTASDVARFVEDAPGAAR